MQSHTCTAPGSLSFRYDSVRLEAVGSLSLSCLVHRRSLPTLVNLGCYSLRRVRESIFESEGENQFLITKSQDDGDEGGLVDVWNRSRRKEIKWMCVGCWSESEIRLVLVCFKWIQFYLDLIKLGRVSFYVKWIGLFR